jgi:AAHS family 4-hydroxybenzoate transporter-like MFS transporter
MIGVTEPRFAGNTMTAISVSSIVDNSRLRPFHIGVFALCSLALIVDGLAVQAIGYTAPSLFADWGIPNSAGSVASFTLFGLLVGSLFFSMLADRIGRRPVLILATAHFGVFTLFTGSASTLEELFIVRFIGGIGMGGIMPNALALVGEYSPKRLRVAVMMIVGNGFTAGAMTGGFIAAWLIPSYGWRSVFYVGGVAALVVAAVMLVLLPESLQFLVVQGRKLGEVRKWLKRVDPSVSADEGARYQVNEEASRGVPIVQLFYEGRALGTIIIWLINFMNLINLYFLSTWLTTVAREAGYPARTAALVGTTLQLGGIIGAVSLGWFIRRLGFIPVLATCLALACFSIAAIGQSSTILLLLFAVVGLSGFFIIGSQAGLNALSGSFYPTHLRSTGIGAGLGIGRVGSIIGPYVGELLRVRWATNELFLVFALPALASSLLMFSLRWAIRPGALQNQTQRSSSREP